jgi:hypothetical protein
MYVEIIGGLLALIISIVGFYVKRAYARMDEIQKELTEHRLVDVEKYVPRHEMQEFADKIRIDIQTIVNSIDRKLQSIEESLRSRRKEDG